MILRPALSQNKPSVVREFLEKCLDAIRSLLSLVVCLLKPNARRPLHFHPRTDLYSFPMACLKLIISLQLTYRSHIDLEKRIYPTSDEDGPWETNDSSRWCVISHDAPFTLCSPLKPFLTYSPEAQSSVQRDVSPWKPLKWKLAFPEIQPPASSDSCTDPGFTDLQEQHPSDSANKISWAFHSSPEGSTSHMLFLPNIYYFCMTNMLQKVFCLGQ